MLFLAELLGDLSPRLLKVLDLFCGPVVKKGVDGLDVVSRSVAMKAAFLGLTFSPKLVSL